MRVLIIEDEIPSRLNLQRALANIATDLHIVGSIGSVKEAVEWFGAHPEGADLVFMDVQLSDGLCFDIFKSVKVAGHVVITTAYDHYALDAFKIHSVDYLLKPIVEEELVRAWGRCIERLESRTSPDIERLMEMVSSAGATIGKEYKKRFTVKAGEKIVIIPVDEIAYCYSEDKSTYAVNKNGNRRLLDYSLDMMQDMLNPHHFFRISRSYIVSINAIENISKHLGTRLKLQLNPHTDDEVVVSRSRTSDFMKWLDNN